MTCRQLAEESLIPNVYNVKDVWSGGVRYCSYEVESGVVQGGGCVKDRVRGEGRVGVWVV